MCVFNQNRLNITEKKFKVINQLPGLFFIKNTDFRFEAMSPQLSKRLGWAKQDQCLGKNDSNIPSKASEIAYRFRTIDEKVVTSARTLLTLDIINHETSLKMIISEKSPIKNHEGLVSHIFYKAIDVTNTNLLSWSKMLYSADQKFLKNFIKSSSYSLSPESSPLNLTPKQQSCLFLILRGKSLRDIAAIFNISVRTVEAHFEAIKYRLDCYNLSQIIEKSVETGFIYYIPKEFIECRYPL